VLVDMWRLVLETARSLDVQVFATTHSRDCYEALAAVAEPGRTEISLQRIERGKVKAVAFSELEIRQAAERGSRSDDPAEDVSARSRGGGQG
jgi:hypothetical protein